MKNILLITLAVVLLSGCYDPEREIKVYKSCLAAGMRAEADSQGKIICIPNEQIRSMADLKRHLRAKEIGDDL